jgi:hypothetical protein
MSLPRVSNSADHVGAEPELLIEFSDKQQASIHHELTAGKIDDESRWESETKLAITFCSHHILFVGLPSKPSLARRQHWK